MLYILYFVIISYALYRLTYVNEVSEDNLDYYIKEAHKYSGISEEHYMVFFSNIKMAKYYKKHKDISNEFMERALENLAELYIINDDIKEEILELIANIRKEFKKISS